MTIRTVHMDFLYGSAFREGVPEAYERLILDAMLGDATLFTRVGRDRGAVGARRRDRRRVAARPAGVPELRRRAPGGRRRPTSCCTATAAPGGGTDACARSLEDWQGEDVSIAEIERELARMRAATIGETRQPNQRTSVMTHIAWVPPHWVEAAERTLEGMEEQPPVADDRPRPDAGRADGLDADLSVRCFPAGDRPSRAR